MDFTIDNGESDMALGDGSIPEPQTMRAVMIDEPGASPLVRSVAIPARPGGQTLIKVVAVALNPPGSGRAAGLIPLARFEQPYIPGYGPRRHRRRIGLCA